MRRLLLLSVLLVGLLAPSEGLAALQPCAGAPPQYVEAFDTLDGSRNNAVSYPYPTFYDEKQTWATPEGQEPGHHSEHIHHGACYPNGVTFTAAVPWQRIDVQYIFFNVEDYRVVQAAQSSVNGGGGSVSLYKASASQLAELQTKMDASGGLTLQRVFQSYPIVAPKTNGLKEIRGGIDVIEDGPTAVFHEWRLDRRNYYTDSYAGLPSVSPPITKQYYVRSRSVVSFPNGAGGFAGDYHHSGEDSYTLTREDIVRYWANGKTWRLRVSDGGDAAMVEVDPNHHAHDPNAPGGEDRGVWHQDLGNSGSWAIHPCACAYVRDVPIPTTGLTPGWHSLVFLSHDAKAGRGTWTNVTVRRFRVR